MVMLWSFILDRLVLSDEAIGIMKPGSGKQPVGTTWNRMQHSYMPTHYQDLSFGQMVWESSWLYT